MRHEPAEYWLVSHFFCDKKIFRDKNGRGYFLPHINPYLFLDGGVIDSL